MLSKVSWIMWWWQELSQRRKLEDIFSAYELEIMKLTRQLIWRPPLWDCAIDIEVKYQSLMPSIISVLVTMLRRGLAPLLGCGNCAQVHLNWRGDVLCTSPKVLVMGGERLVFNSWPVEPIAKYFAHIMTTGYRYIVLISVSNAPFHRMVFHLRRLISRNLLKDK